MNPQEYENLLRVEKTHWYYRGKREIAEYWLRREGQLHSGAILADVGAGTGEFVLQMRNHCRVLAVDDYSESVAILEDRLPAAEVRRGSCVQLPIESDSCDFVSALDVLEHIEDDKAAITELWRIAKPGGIIVITVPALSCLWSDWDVSLRHYRRYDLPGLRTLGAEVPSQVLHLNYMNFFAFPAVWLIRRLRRQKGAGSPDSRSEDQIPPSWINEILHWIFVRSSCQNLIRWPFGVGLLCVLKKR